MFKINDQCRHGLDRFLGGTIGQPIPSACLGTMTNVVVANDITCLLLIENHALFSVLWQLIITLVISALWLIYLDILNFSFENFYAELVLLIGLFRFSAFVTWILGYLIAKGLKFETVNSAILNAKV